MTDGEKFNSLLLEMREMYESKNKDYGNSLLKQYKNLALFLQ